MLIGQWLDLSRARTNGIPPFSARLHQNAVTFPYRANHWALAHALLRRSDKHTPVDIAYRYTQYLTNQGVYSRLTPAAGQKTASTFRSETSSLVVCLNTALCSLLAL